MGEAAGGLIADVQQKSVDDDFDDIIVADENNLEEYGKKASKQ